MPKTDWRLILALLTAGLIVSTGTPIGTPSIGSAVASASANIADDLSASAAAAPHLGFDTFAYPGDDAMRAWLTADKYRWVGYYLPAPCHNDDSWEGKRDTLSEMGWGMAVIYVGQQTWGRTPGQNPQRETRRPLRQQAPPGESCHYSARLAGIELLDTSRRRGTRR
jgi:hypothetical protein